MVHPLVVKSSPHPVEETANRLQHLLQTKKIQLFARINHSLAAKENGLSLADEELLIFGDPKVGTYLMQESPAMGIELPLKILIWHQDQQTLVGYREPKMLLSVYSISEHNVIIEKMSTLMANLVNEIIQPEKKGG